MTHPIASSANKPVQMAQTHHRGLGLSWRNRPNPTTRAGITGIRNLGSPWKTTAVARVDIQSQDSAKSAAIPGARLSLPQGGS